MESVWQNSDRVFSKVLEDSIIIGVNVFFGSLVLNCPSLDQDFELAE